MQTQAAADILQHGPPAPSVSAPLVVSVDGVMAPLRRGEWAEVKTLVVGAVDRAVGSDLHTLSYFARLSDAATFGETAVVETHRRGVPVAREVAAVVDGAEWIQGFRDLHCPDAVRILDFPHAAEHIHQLGQAALGSDTATAQTWLTAQLQALKQTGPAGVLATLRALVTPDPDGDGDGPGDGDGDSMAGADHLASLEKRVAQIQYPAFAWEEAWAQIMRELRRQAQQEAARRRQQRREGRVPLTLPTAQPVALLAAPYPAVLPTPSPSEPAPTVAPHNGARPAADHPWRRAWRRRQQAEQVRTA